MSDLQHDIEAAETKDELETLAQSLGVNLNRRKGMETLRAELAEAVAPSASPAPAPSAPRLLRHVTNGRVFIWTAALAKRRDLKEV